MGFSRDRFDKKINTVFICEICNDVLELPRMLPDCEHFFCSLCISSLETQRCPLDSKEFALDKLCEPNSLFSKFYSSLMVKCLFEKCSEDVRMDKLDKHELECEHNPDNVKDTSVRIEPVQIQQLISNLEADNQAKQAQAQQLESIVRDLRKSIKLNTAQIQSLKNILPKETRAENSLTTAVKSLLHLNGSTPKNDSSISSNSTVPKSVETRASSSSSPSPSPKLKFEVDLLIPLYSNMLEKLVKFRKVASIDYSLKWSQNPIKEFLLKLAESKKLQENIAILNVLPFISQEFFTSLFDPIITATDASIVLNVAIMQLLEYCEIHKKKSFLLIGSTGCFLVPIITNYGNRAVQLCGDALKKSYDRKEELKTDFLYHRFRYFLLNPNSLIETLSKIKESMFNQFDYVISYDQIDENCSKLILEHHCRKGMMLIVNPVENFEKRSLNECGEQTVLVYGGVDKTWSQFARNDTNTNALRHTSV